MHFRNRTIGQKINGLLLKMVFFTMILAGVISVYSLRTLQAINREDSEKLGETAVENMEKVLKDMAVQYLEELAEEKAESIQDQCADEQSEDYLAIAEQVITRTDLGNVGCVFLVDEAGEILTFSGSSVISYIWRSQSLLDSENEAIKKAALEMTAGIAGNTKVTADGKEVYLVYAPLTELGWSLVTAMDVSKMVVPARENEEEMLQLLENIEYGQDMATLGLLVLFGLAFLASLCLISAIGTHFSKKITEPIGTLTKAVSEIEGGKVFPTTNIHTGDEIEKLDKAFRKMTIQLQEDIANLQQATADKERIRTEIDVAAKVQDDMLPKGEDTFPERDEFLLDALMKPAKGVGGDFYDFFLIDNHRLALVIGDVSGKGVPAALFMVVAKTLICSQLSSGKSLEQSAESINKSLCSNNKSEMFVTAWIGVLDISTGDLEYVNAGHCRPLVLRSDGSSAFEDQKSGFVLGGMEDITYQRQMLHLNPGDTIYLYTDGVTEATSVGERLYGEERLQKAASKGIFVSPRELLLGIWDDVCKFQRGREQFDDVTMLALTYCKDGYFVKSGAPLAKESGEYAEFVKNALTKWSVSDQVLVTLQMAVDEIYSNICFYSQASEVSLKIFIKEEEKEVCLIFEDDGTPFNPLRTPEPDLEKPLHERKEGGLGMYLVKKSMDKVMYEYVNKKNQLMLSKSIL